MPAGNSRAMKLAWMSVALATLLAAMPAAAGDKRAPVLVELFTSQGCGSCRTADLLVQDLADRGDLLVLAFHVDYWDHLGWKDTLATRKGTARQYAYRESLQERMVFTPQIVVDGRVSISGTDRAAVVALIDRETGRPAETSRTTPLLIESRREADGSIRVSLPFCSDVAAPIPLWLIEYDDRQDVVISKGENAGRSFTYRHPVRAVSRIGEWKGPAEDLVLPPASLQGERRGLILAQEERAGPIRAAGRLPQAR